VLFKNRYISFIWCLRNVRSVGEQSSFHAGLKILRYITVVRTDSRDHPTSLSTCTDEYKQLELEDDNSPRINQYRRLKCVNTFFKPPIIFHGVT